MKSIAYNVSTLKLTGLSGFWVIILLIIFTTPSCNTPKQSDGPFFGNGVHNGWADQHSVVIWTRLTQNAEMIRDDAHFIPISEEKHRHLWKLADKDSINLAQIPDSLELDDMYGACPGSPGEVSLSYYPENNPDDVVSLDWAPVDTNKNFTHQWVLNDLLPGTSYRIQLQARKSEGYIISDTMEGYFKTPPERNEAEEISFAVVTCHDFPRRDDSIMGHKIYPSMLYLQPDFYVHTGDIEYYDKPDPYAMTEELMRFKWDRLFALPYQRDFFRQVTCYFIKDDHDALCNDVFPGMYYGTVSFERGLEIFDKEQFPTNEKPFKTVRWGKDLQIWMVEGRNYRSKNIDADGPGKSILGKEQKEWLFETMLSSDATFRVLISPTPILGPDRLNKHDNYSNFNFKYEGDEIRHFLDSLGNVIICNGDRHWQYVTHWDNTNLWEFGCGAGSDSHAGGWDQDDRRPEHRFLRVKGGFLFGKIIHKNNEPALIMTHHDVDGNIVHEERFSSTQ